MSLAGEAPAPGAAAFRPRTILVMVFVALFAFSAFSVLATYAPEMRSGQDGGAHALSRSAVGFAGAVALLKAQGTPVMVSRAQDLRSGQASLVVLTPSPRNSAEDLNRLASRKVTLIVLPKWAVAADPLRPGWVNKLTVVADSAMAQRLLSRLAKSSELATRKGVERPVLRLAPGIRVSYPDGRPMPFDRLQPGPVDRLQTISGEGWSPILIDDAGRVVLAASQAAEQTYVLADPDLINTHGLKSLDTARTAMDIVQALRRDNAGVVFDVSLAGFGRSRNLGKLMLEPPILGATLCAIAAALLMGLHGLVRFGPTPPARRALALGALGLVDNTAGLVRLGRKEADLAQPYAALVQAETLRAVGGGRGEAGERLDRLDRLERQRRISVSRRELVKSTAEVKTPADLLAIARGWRRWRLEMTRDRR